MMHAMAAPWLESVTPIAPPTSASPSMRFLVYAGAVTGAWAGLLCLIVYGIGRLVRVPFEVAVGSGAIEPVPWFAPLLTPIAAALLAALLSGLLRGLAHAGRLVFWAGTVLAIASAWVPIDQPAGVAWSTRILLVLMHAITWALVVPQLARIVRDSEPGQHADPHA
jgi:hypothetical protein